MLKLRFTLFTGLLLAMLVACGSGDRTLNEADPDIVAQRPTFAQVYPIFQRDCIPCHSGTARDRGNGMTKMRMTRTSRGSGAAFSVSNPVSNPVNPSSTIWMTSWRTSSSTTTCRQVRGRA